VAGESLEVLYKIFHGAVINIGEDMLPEKGIHPLVKSVSACVDRRLFEWIAFTTGQRLELNFGLLLECNVGRCFDERLFGVDTKLFELFGSSALGDRAGRAHPQRHSCVFRIGLARYVTIELDIR
jgi:hypothetical protein